MAFKFKKGDLVQQVMPAPIKGEVTGYSLDQTTGAVSAKVEWLDASGDVHSRFFSEDEIAVDDEAIAEKAPGDPDADPA